MSVRDWLLIRAGQLISRFRRCPDCGRRGYNPILPRWEDDPIVIMNEWFKLGQCPGCGREVTS